MKFPRALALGITLAISLPASALAMSPSQAVAIPEGVHVPTWNELPPRQRKDLARFQPNWDRMPASRRVAILERYARWQRASPQARETWREGERNFQQMSPLQRQQMRRSLAVVRELPPEKQRHLRRIWQSLSPEERRLWLERGGPGLSTPPGADRP